MDEVDRHEWDDLLAKHQRGTWAYLFEKDGHRRLSSTYAGSGSVIAAAEKASTEGRERVVGLVTPNGKRHPWSSLSR